MFGGEPQMAVILALAVQRGEEEILECCSWSAADACIECLSACSVKAGSQLAGLGKLETSQKVVQRN